MRFPHRAPPSALLELRGRVRGNPNFLIDQLEHLAKPLFMRVSTPLTNLMSADEMDWKSYRADPEA
jgi:hypothetical protein